MNLHFDGIYNVERRRALCWRLSSALVLAALLGSGAFSDAYAACRCACVSGRMEAVCSSPLDVRPSCTGICAPEPPQMPSVQVPPLGPPGTKSCRIEHVCDPAASGGRCREETVCR